jgi:putative FmdB family regulatory protein
MPRWDFYCKTCDHSYELGFKDLDASQNAKCPKCGSHVKRLAASGVFILKGAGFHKNDYPSAK